MDSLKRALGDSYTVERELLGGAMSRVFVAQDNRLGRRVAIKVLLREVAAEVKTERFRLEIQLAAKLQHPHIVPLLQSGEVEGILYFTMPFIDGESLRTRIERDGGLPMADALRTLRQVASAISYAHKHGVVHRDIKPDNVLIADEFALVTDFGVAKALSASTSGDDARLTGGGIAIGTPAYMAPEQALAEPDIDHRSDIYAFGILAYEVLTGKPPFRAASAQATLAAHVLQQPEPIDQKRADIPPAVADLVMRCLAKKPGDRPDSGGDILQVFDAAAMTPRTGDMPPVSLPRRRSWRGIALAVAGMTAAATLAIFASKRAGARADTSEGSLSSVAVLPLVNVGGSQGDEYFSDGMTDELANTLGRLPGLRVASRTSTYAFKGQKANVEEIGHKLNVKAVLEGTVRRSGNRLRVAAQLTSVSDGLAMWSDTYERETRDVFSVQDDIARSIADALKLRLGRQANTFASDSRGTANLAAFDDYLRGRYFWNRRGADNLRLAVSYFDSAIAQDARFARAHAARAIALALLPEYTDTPPPSVVAMTHEAADRALALDSSLAEAYAALGLAGVHEWNFSAADAAYRKALALEPRYPTAHQWYGELLFHTGRVDSSLAQIRVAADLDPLAPIIPAALGYALIAAREYTAAEEVLRKGIQLAPTLGLHRAMLGHALMMEGRKTDAMRELELAARLDPELALRRGYLAYGYGLSGETDKARALISSLSADRAGRRGGGVALAIAHLGVGERDLALKALEQAVSEHDISLVTSLSLVPDKIWDPLRSEPRFDEILRRMNLYQYAHGVAQRSR